MPCVAMCRVRRSHRFQSAVADDGAEDMGRKLPQEFTRKADLAVSEGFEPPTPRFEVWCSIRLSYETGMHQKTTAAGRR